MAENDKQLQLVTFQLGNEKYGIDIMEVNEIVKMQDIRPIPNAPPYVEGIYNLRGIIIPIINLHRRFKIKKLDFSEEDVLLSGFIIISINNTLIGVIIDKVLRVVTITDNSIHPPPRMLTGIGAEYISGVYKEDDDYLVILDIEHLFDPRELQQLEKIST